MLGSPATMLTVPPVPACGVETMTGIEDATHPGAETVRVPLPSAVALTVKYLVDAFVRIVSGLCTVPIPAVSEAVVTSTWSML